MPLVNLYMGLEASAEVAYVGVGTPRLKKTILDPLS